jgi:hypothetical protein
MQNLPGLVGTLADVFTWVGLLGAAVFGIVAVILWVADGTWLPVRGVVEPAEPDGQVVRWIDADGGVNEAPLSDADHARLGGRDMADIHYRRGWRNRMRVSRGSRAVRLVAWLAVGFAGLGIVALIGSWVLLAVQG